MSSVTVRCFPSVDDGFAREVEALVAAARSSGRRAELEPHALEQSLRRTHVNAVVSVRQQLARRGDEVGPMWYVFRDGGLASRMSGPRRILVVDDDESFAMMLEAILVQAGFDVRRAADGEAGLDLANAFAPSLILLDLAMPRSSGEDFAKRYREAPDPLAQIVVVSGVQDAWKRAQATDARAIVRKPFEMGPFLELVRHLA